MMVIYCFGWPVSHISLLRALGKIQYGLLRTVSKRPYQNAGQFFKEGGAKKPWQLKDLIYLIENQFFIKKKAIETDTNFLKNFSQD